MKFAAGLTATGIIGWLLLEALKIVMVPVTAWVMGILAVVLKFALIALGLLVAAVVIGVGIYVVRRSRSKEATT